jgi:hypothetical protein
MACDACTQDLFSLARPADNMPPGTYTDGKNVFAPVVRDLPSGSSSSNNSDGAGPITAGGPSGPTTASAAASSTSASLRCLSCPNGAVCLGGAAIVPQSGWWHSAPNSTSMHSCMNLAACREGNDQRQSLLASCQTAWYKTSPPGLNPYVLPDGRKCLLWTLSSDARAVAGSPANPGDSSAVAAPGRRSLQQGGTASGRGTSTSDTVLYTDLQCMPGYYSNLCGACQVRPIDDCCRA